MVAEEESGHPKKDEEHGHGQKTMEEAITKAEMPIKDTGSNEVLFKITEDFVKMQ